MRKFYYRKEESLDSRKATIQGPRRDFDAVRDELIKSFKTKTPIILRLDRRHTINKDGLREEVSRFRTTSISSLDQFKDIPTIPRIRNRDITKSLSEDVLSNSKYSTASTMVITETELSSSWLYKNMKAASNPEEDDENHTPKYSKENASRSRSIASEPDLSPVMLQDPKMKPVPVPTTPRLEKASSRCCYLAILMIISICTLGFISTIGGIIYLEVFSNKSTVINPTVEKAMDALNLLREGQIKVVDEPKLLNNKDINGVNDSTFKKHESEKPNDSIAMDQDQRKTIHIVDFGYPLATELNQYVDNTRTELRLHEDNSVIYEETSVKSVEHQATPDVSRNIENNKLDASVENDPNKLEKHSNQSEGLARAVFKTEENLKLVDKTEENLEKFETFLNTRFNPLSELISRISSVNLPSQRSTTNQSNGKENNITGSNVFSHLTELYLEELEPVAETRSDEVSEKPMEQEPKMQVDDGKIDENPTEKNDVQHKTDNDKQIGLQILTDHGEEKPLPGNSNESKEHNVEDKEKPAIVHQEVKEPSSSDENKSQDDDDSDENYESLITVINEHIQEVSKQESDTSNRDGDLHIPVSNTNSRTTVVPERVNMNRPSDSSQSTLPEIPQDPGSKKPVDIKVSLAEAMKVLQVLDPQNRFPSSRTKFVNPKLRTTKPTPGINLKRNKEEEELEKKLYLNKLRIAFFDRMQ